MGAIVLANWGASDEEKRIAQEAWPPDCQVYWFDSLSDDQQATIIPKTRVIVGGIPANILDLAAKLELVHMLGHGIDGVMRSPVREHLIEKKVIVLKASPADVNISEFVLMSLVILSRRILPMHTALAYEGSWSPQRKAGRMQGSLGGELYGSTLGLVGFGPIGRAIYDRARAFGMKVSAVVRRPDRLRKLGLDLEFIGSPDQLNDMLSQTRYVVLSLPLTDATRNLFDQERFQAMQGGSYLINISRGPIVAEQALYEALKTGRLAGAASDVWSIEEDRGATRGYPTEYPLHQFNVLMTPHYSGATQESRTRAIQNVGANLGRWLKGEQLTDIGDLELGF